MKDEIDINRIAKIVRALAIKGDPETTEVPEEIEELYNSFSEHEKDVLWMYLFKWRNEPIFKKYADIWKRNIQ